MKSTYAQNIKQKSLSKIHKNFFLVVIPVKSNVITCFYPKVLCQNLEILGHSGSKDIHGLRTSVRKAFSDCITNTIHKKNKLQLFCYNEKLFDAKIMRCLP